MDIISGSGSDPEELDGGNSVAEGEKGSEDDFIEVEDENEEGEEEEEGDRVDLLVVVGLLREREGIHHRFPEGVEAVETH